jgi:RNA polymerase sigma-70 factor (ECF subfamily)
LDIDNRLVSSTLNGDVHSFSILVEKYQVDIFNFLFRLTLCREDAEELLQDVFVRVYKYLYTYNSSMKFSSWLYSIAVNTFKDHFKRKKKQLAICSFDDEINTGVKQTNQLEIDLETREEFREIVKIINSLKEEYRIAIILKCIQDFSYKEIGEMLGISPQNAKMRVNRARRKIGKSLNKMNGGAF